MESRDQAQPIASQGGGPDRAPERRYGEETHADRGGRGDAYTRSDDAHGGSGGQQEGMASSSATVGLGTEAGMDSAHGSAIEGTQQVGGTGSADHGSLGTVNAGGSEGLSSGNPTADASEPTTATDSAWQSKRAEPQ